MQLKCIIIDDEPLAIALVETYISRTSILSLIGTTDSLQKGVEEIKTKKPDIVFMDINIRGIDEPKIEEIFHNKSHVIIISAYPKTVLDKLLFFDFSKAGYLNKPVSFSAFTKEVMKYCI